MTVALSARLTRAPRDSVVGHRSATPTGARSHCRDEERVQWRTTSRSCSCVTARPSGAARASTRRTPTSRSRDAGASRRADARRATAGRRASRWCSPARATRALRHVRVRGPRRPRAEITDDLAEWNYGDYEGRTTSEIRSEVPGWTIFTHGAPGGETADEVAARADRVLARAVDAAGDVALFSHGHFLRVLGARWIGLAGDGAACSGSTPRPSACSATSGRNACCASGTRESVSGFAGASPSRAFEDLDGLRDPLRVARLASVCRSSRCTSGSDSFAAQR